MQPYQTAGKEIQRQGEVPIKALKTAGAIGGSALGASVLTRVIPLLSQYIPQDLAIKGLSKIDPRFGKFINKSMAEGSSFDDVKEFIREKSSSVPEEERNIIKQYSPELHAFIDQEIKKGRSPIEAGAIAQNDKKYKSVIDKLSKDHKTNWSNILESVYGSGDKAQQQPQQSQQTGGPGQQALMGILQKLNQSRGRQ